MEALNEAVAVSYLHCLSKCLPDYYVGHTGLFWAEIKKKQNEFHSTASLDSTNYTLSAQCDTNTGKVVLKVITPEAKYINMGTDTILT